ncbi:hypothetical protein CTI12_AA401370 [Artemisia annua]|uniref:Uncharacterized protein n=1 Tax=Artemisia annua TaxID=35608 RepID=A0A2U1MA39_ARTAN|nr:hypothetical protein CTI12_AA401370 [Artemisia annua]
MVILGSGKLSMDGEENKNVGSGGHGSSGSGNLNEKKLSSQEKSESVATEPKIANTHEQDIKIKFGEVVQAPPKLVNVPKKFGSSINASQERIRLRAIEAYREQKKWASRPGLNIPTADLTQAGL